ncbi:MAG: glycosyltransferase [Patescibacteria group bacterium]|nr:glycosyltransferase [Patescibacteria group bacterium]
MKLAFFYDSLSPLGGGSQNAVLLWLKNLKNKEIEFKLLTSSHSFNFIIKKKIIKKDQIVSLPSINASFLLPKFYISYCLKRNELLNFNPDIIQLNEPSLLDNSFISLAKKKQIKIGVFYHTNYQNFSLTGKIISFYQNLIIKKADFILVPSETFKINLNKKYQNIPIYRIYYPINKCFYKNEKSIFNKTIFGRKKLKLLYFGRLSQEKKVDFIIDVLSYLPSFFTLNIVGDGKQKNYLIEKSKKNKLSNRINFLGHLSSPTIANQLKSTFLTLSPSTIETFGMTYLESLASVVPLIACDYQTTKEVVPKNCAILMKELNPKEWADVILTLYKNEKKYFFLKKEIIKNYFYLKKYSEENSIKRLIKIYENIYHHSSL